MALTVAEIAPGIGARIEADRASLLGGAHAERLRRLLAERVVLVLPQAGFDDDELLAFSRTLGDVIPFCETGVRPISREGIGGDYIATSFFWHFDGALDAVHSRAGLLAARRLPASGGGQTQFANTLAAYADLTAPDKAMIDGLRIVHSFEANQRLITPVPTFAQILQWRERHPPRTHPMVWHHRDGRESLAIGTTASHVEGLSVDDSNALLARMLDWATQPRYTYSHDWQVGDVVVYDNTTALHRVLPYAQDSGRLMHRTSLAGEEPLV